MEGFLQTCSAAVKASSQNSPGFHVVLGNEACDLDSMVSSLAFAYFLSRTAGGPGNPVPVPVLNIPRVEFPLRSDSVFLLKESGVPPETLVFRDDLDLARLHGDKKLTLTLVDHNVLARADQALEEVVVEVIDHHRLDRPTSSSCSVTVETVGSCATLVTDQIFRKAPEVLDRQLALLLYGTIVLDCVNMAPEAGKVTSRDSQAVRLLEAQFPDLPPRGGLFQALQNAKFDVSGLSTEQILLKDMKKVAEGDLRIAVCTVYLTLELFLQRRALQQELCEFCHKHQLSLLVAMTISFEDKESFRQLAVYSSSTLYRQEVSQALENTRSPFLNLTPLSSPYKDIQAYHQGNAVASRKRILPVLKDFLSDWERRQVHSGDVEEELEDQLDMSESTPSPGNGSDDLRPRVYSSSRHHRRRLLGADECGLEDEGGEAVPPTPMNSLVEGCPLDGPLPPHMISQEALLEKFSRLGGGGGRGEEEENQ